MTDDPSITTAVPEKPSKRKMTFKRQAKRLAILVAGTYILGFIVALCFINRVLYWPHESSYSDDARITKLMTADGVQISAMWLPNAKARYTILYSHGNGEDMGDMEPYYQGIRNSGYAVLGYDYHGYGTSQGSPSEEATYADINAAYDWLVNVQHVSPERILLLGRSIGGGPATDLAIRRPVGGLILESAFTSAFRVATHWPIFPKDRYCNLEKLPKVHCPVLVVHGRDDGVVRFWHGQKNYAAANDPKQFLWVEGAGHNDLMLVGGQSYLQALDEFVKLVDQQRSPRVAASMPE